MDAARYTAARDHVSAYPEPLRLRAGERVQVGPEYDGNPQWRGWLWCTAASGRSGWVPKDLLRITGGEGVAAADYDAAELSVAAGTPVRVDRIRNGWAWAEAPGGDAGWVPFEGLEPVAWQVGDGVTVRGYREADRGPVIELWRACGLVVSWNDPDRDIDRKLAADPGGFWIGEAGNRPVATCMAGYDGHRGWINYLAVAPPVRRRAIGRRLLAAAEDRLAALGCPKINLQVREGNEDALRFYERCGFTVDPVRSMGRRLTVDGTARRREPGGTAPPAASRRVDLSHAVRDGLVTYPGLPAPAVTEFLSREASRPHYDRGTTFQIGRIDMVANTGTYLDAPFHRYADGADLSGLDLERLADLEGVVVRAAPGTRRIGPEAFRGRDLGGRAVLVHTGWDRRWNTADYFEGHPFLTDASARLLEASGAVLVGIDSLNIDDTRDGRRPVHSILLSAGIPVVEHLCGLGALPDDGFRFFAVPVKVEGLGSFPVRAFALVP
jgi:kynurenine formamidase/ribosomal protein S18 acetylase RimI-like enzyme